MIEQQRRIVRARDLAAFKDALVDLATGGPPLSARRRAVIVPTRAAAELLRQTIEARTHGAVLLPDFLTRAELLERWLRAVSGHPRLLGRVEREVLLERAARVTAARPKMGGAPFPLRPGLVAAMLDFYDELRRRQRTAFRMADTLFQQLKVERATDRGSEALLHQTSFLGFAFLAYERLVAAGGALDEHTLRQALLTEQPVLPYGHVVIAVADHPSDIRGLWPADFDLLGRLRHLSRIDIVVTDGAHDAGFRERLELELPGVEEDRRTASYPSPILVRPSEAPDDAICFVSRDREEELREVARAIRERAAAAGGTLRDRTAVVFHRPLPYLYLSQQVLTEARVPYQAFDALPLAAEPYAALLDVVMTMARTGGTRESSIELLRSRLLRIDVDGAEVLGRDAAALDQALTERRATGDASSFLAEVEAFFRDGEGRRKTAKAGAVRAARAAAHVGGALAGLRDASSAAAQVGAIATFLRRHERVPDAGDSLAERHMRARAAVLGALDGLAAAFELHDNDPRPDEDITAAIRHAIEAQTFTPKRGSAGVHLVDAVAARFGEFDHVHVVGLVETDWPERPRRNIFYTSGLLRELGWPQETDQARVERAAFFDLLGLPARTLRLSAFQLEGDAIVALSPMVEIARGVSSSPSPGAARQRVFDDEVITTAPLSALTSTIETGAADWLRLRHARQDISTPRYGGSVGPQAPQRYRVSRVDHYTDCPFKYFAENVLGLPEERDEAAGLTPLERGMLVHHLFEQFFRDWDQDPGGSITAATLPEAIARFTALTETALARMPEADRVLERTRLLGSLVAPGIAERVFELEVDSAGQVARRLLESDLRGPFDFPQLGGLKQRTIEIAGKADRIDVLDDGSLRVVDYKLSRLPDKETSIQIAVYAHAAKALLERADSQSHRIAAAMYLAFGDEDEFEGSLGNRDRKAADVVLARVEAFAAIIDRIESGEFPPQPRRLDMCGWCRYAGVCRKEYREGADETAESL